MRRDSNFCAKSVRYNIFTNGAPYAQMRLRKVLITQHGMTEALTVTGSNFVS